MSDKDLAEALKLLRRALQWTDLDKALYAEVDAYLRQHPEPAEAPVVGTGEPIAIPKLMPSQEDMAAELADLRRDLQALVPRSEKLEKYELLGTVEDLASIKNLAAKYQREVCKYEALGLTPELAEEAVQILQNVASQSKHLDLWLAKLKPPQAPEPELPKWWQLLKEAPYRSNPWQYGEVDSEILEAEDLIRDGLRYRAEHEE